MKRTLSLVLSFALCLSFAILSGTAASADFFAAGGDITLPASAQGDGILVGWSANITGENVFLAPGEKYTLSQSAIFKPVFVRFSTDSGASVRTTVPTGLRFSTTVNEQDYTALASLCKDFSFGTIICPTDMIKSEFTKDAVKNDGGTVLSIPAKVWFSQNDEARVYTGVISNIKESNYPRRFSARAVLEIKYTNGERRVYYGEYDEKVHSRSVSYVSSAALADSSVVWSDEAKLTLEGYLELKRIDISLTKPALGEAPAQAKSEIDTYGYTLSTKWLRQPDPMPEVFLDDFAYRSIITVTPCEGMVITDNTEIYYNGNSLRGEDGALLLKADKIENNTLSITRTYQSFGVSWAY